MNQSEEWRPIPGLPRYLVSDQGRVVSHRRWTPRLLRPTIDTGGYHRINPSVDGVVLSRRIHVLVAEAFIGPRPEGMEVRHLNGVHTDNRLVNIAYGSPSQNAQDQVTHGVHANAKKTHCPQDHRYDEANTYHYGGFRFCRTCQRDRRTNAALRAANVPTSAAA